MSFQTEVFCQRNSFEFSSGIKSNSLGKYLFTRENNLGFDFLNNPACTSLDTNLSIGFASKRINNINQIATFFHPKMKIGNFIFGIQSIPIGKIDEYDNSGLKTGQFSSNFSNIIVGYSIFKKNMSFGISNVSNIFLIQNFNNIHNYLNLSGLYENKNQGFGIGWNINQISLFNSSSIKVLPNLVFGGSLKPKYLPLRLHASMFDLISKNYFKNFSIGSEFFVNKPFNLFIGYNSATINKIRIGLKFNKDKFSFLAGTELGKLQTNSIEINLKLK